MGKHRPSTALTSPTLSDLKRSGISKVQAAKLGITDHAESADDDAHYRFWYHEPDGTRRAHYNRRYLHRTNPDDPRYLGKPGSRPQAYFPLGVDWPTLLADPTQPLIITEGEKKAIKSCLSGFPCLGLMGVSSHGAKLRGVDLITDLSDIAWKDRTVFILYDSDLEANKDVRTGLVRLALKLGKRGADVRGGYVPELDGEKTGIDDYLVKRPASEFKEMLHMLDSLSPTSDRRVQAWIDDHIFLKKHSTTLCLSDIEHVLYNKRELEEQTTDKVLLLDPNTLRQSYQSVARVGFESDFRQEAWDYKLRPDLPPREIFQVGQLSYINTWRGFAIDPVRGVTKPWDTLLKHLVPIPEERSWLEDWLAHMLQHPEIKMRSVPCVYSSAQGVGKSSIGDVIGQDIMGDYYWPAGQDQLFSRFNAFIAGRLFVMGDDLVFKNNLAEYRAAAKTLFERSTNTVEEKYERKGKSDISCNFYLNGNDLHAFPLDPTGSNRRFGLLAGPTSRTLPPTFYTQEFDRWRKQGGAGAVLYKYLHRKLDNFDPNADAIHTSMKDEAVALQRPEHISWVVEVHERTGLCLAEPKMLWSRFQAEHPRATIKEATFYHQLKQIYPDSQRILRKLYPYDTNKRKYIITDGRYAHWHAATAQQLRDQLDKQAGQHHESGGVN